MPADGHGDFLRHSCTYKVANSCSTQIVKNHALINHFCFRLRARPTFWSVLQLSRIVCRRIHLTELAPDASSIPALPESPNLDGMALAVEPEADIRAAGLALGVAL